MTEDIQLQLNRIERNSLIASKNVLTFEDAALLTGLAKSTLYKLTCEHRIPCYKPTGKQIFFDKKELEDWLKQNRVTSDSEIDRKATSYLVCGKNKGRK